MGGCCPDSVRSKPNKRSGGSQVPSVAGPNPAPAIAEAPGAYHIPDGPLVAAAAASSPPPPPDSRASSAPPPPPDDPEPHLTLSQDSPVSPTNPHLARTQAPSAHPKGPCASPPPEADSLNPRLDGPIPVYPVYPRGQVVLEQPPELEQDDETTFVPDSPLSPPDDNNLDEEPLESLTPPNRVSPPSNWPPVAPWAPGTDAMYAPLRPAPPLFVAPHNPYVAESSWLHSGPAPPTQAVPLSMSPALAHIYRPASYYSGIPDRYAVHSAPQFSSYLVPGPFEPGPPPPRSFVGSSYHQSVYYPPPGDPRVWRPHPPNPYPHSTVPQPTHW